MTSTATNPFPDYAVTRLSVGQDGATTTVVTPGIQRGRDLVRGYLAGVGVTPEPGRSNAALCAVRGDYGTGKTHLLNDVASELMSATASTQPVSIVRVTCIETDPLSWFRAKVAPQLESLPLYDIALELYGRAGGTVAAATPLTESASEVLAADPARIRDLVRADHLSIDEVGREFEKQLGLICKDYDAPIRRVVSRLVSSETEGPARKWIGGATLLPREAEFLGVAPAIESLEQASAVIAVIATIHKAVKRPFVFLVDELEHFVRYDSSHGSQSNITWFKRLLERLAGAGALALVAGHWSAWDTAKDYLDRFPQHAPIDLIKLEATDVLTIVRTLVQRLPAGFGEEQAQVVAAITGGNMRRVMSLCSVLFRQTNGFSYVPESRQIHEAWTSIAQRISQEQALDEIAQLLEGRGFAIQANASFDSIPFDLAAARNGSVVVVQAKHSSTQHAHYDAARQFLGKLDRVGNSGSSVIGMFLANGSVDDELVEILRGAHRSNLFWFDLTTRDAMDRIRAEIGALDGRLAPAPAPAPQNAAPKPPRGKTKNAAALAVERSEEQAGLRAQNAELERRLQELEERRRQETDEIRRRLAELAEQRLSARQDSLRTETELSPERAHASYEAMLQPPSFNRKLHYMSSPSTAALALYLILSAVVVARPSLLLAPMLGDYNLQLEAVTVLSGILVAVGSLLLIWRQYLRVSGYFEFARQVISDLYIRDVPVTALAQINMVLRRAIDEVGAARAPKVAIAALREQKLPAAAVSYFESLDVRPLGS